MKARIFLKSQFDVDTEDWNCEGSFALPGSSCVIAGWKTWGVESPVGTL